jgi:hypothetical protein
MRELPPELADALRPVLPQLAEDTIAAIGREVPDYARPMEGEFGRAVRAAIEHALRRFVDRIAEPEGGEDPLSGMYAALGRGELRAGRSLGALLSAYRIGARLAWERFSAAGDAAGHDPRALYALASQIFSYIDAISAESVDGYAEEQTRAAGERERRRRALVRLLARDDVAPEEVADLAGLAGWPLPASLAAIVADPAAERAVARLGPDALGTTDDGLVLAFLADPDAPGRRAQVLTALQGAPAAVGPTVAPAVAAHSLARARATYRLLQEDRLDGASPAFAEDHLLELLLAAGDGALAAELAAVVLAPLDDLGTGARARAVRTLRAWLDHPGQVQRVAAELGVHPQTVPYPMTGLRERFGTALEDADTRFALAVALRATACPARARDRSVIRP